MTGQPAADYITYVHLLDAGGRQVAGFDQAPAGERSLYRYWRTATGSSTLPVMLPPDVAPGEYAVWVGLYEADSGGALRHRDQRLSAGRRRHAGRTVATGP